MYLSKEHFFFFLMGEWSPLLACGKIVFLRACPAWQQEGTDGAMGGRARKAGS